MVSFEEILEQILAQMNPPKLENVDFTSVLEDSETIDKILSELNA